MRRLRERIAEATSRLSWQQAGQLAQLAARTGVVWASRKALATMLGIGRRTLDRVLTELDGLVFVVAAVEGRQGGTVLVPIWGRRNDAPPLDAQGRAAVLAGYLRRAGALDLSLPAVARSLRGVGALIICTTTLPAKALRLLAFALAKLRHVWQRESGLESQSLESPTPTAELKEAAAPTKSLAPTPTVKSELEPAPSEPPTEPPPAAQGALQEEVERASTTSQAGRPRADTATMRASAERLGIRPADSPSKPRPPAAPPTTSAGRHRLLDTAFLRARPLPDEASLGTPATPAPAAAREGPGSQPPIRGGVAPPGGRSLLEVARAWLRRLVSWSR